MKHVNTMCGSGRHLASDFADIVQYWLSCKDVHLQTLAVKICCNLSLLQSHRAALAEIGIFDSVFRKAIFLCP